MLSQWVSYITGRVTLIVDSQGEVSVVRLRPVPLSLLNCCKGIFHGVYPVAGVTCTKY